VQTFRSAFRAARADKLMATDPFELITLPSAEGERIVPLLPSQVALIADKVSQRYRAIVVVQAGLGLRVGEALGLRRDDIDFLRHKVRIRAQIDPDTSALIEPKTTWSRREVPLPDSVAAELSAHLAAFPLYPCADDFPWRGLIFHTRTGRPHTRQEYRTRVFNGAVRALHKADPTFPVGTTTHDLRHYFATVLLDAGESVVTVAELLGHKDATLVVRTYGHRMPGREDRARRVIDAAFASSAAPAPDSLTAPGRPR
jgi:integrase